MSKFCLFSLVGPWALFTRFGAQDAVLISCGDPKGPPRKIGNFFFYDFWAFFRPTQKMGPDGPKWAQEDFFPTNPDLADILGRTDFDFENFYFFDFLGPKFLAWAHLGPSLGPAWAQLGPGLGPPTWARHGPTHFGPAWAHPLGPGWGPPTWALRVARSLGEPVPA